MGSPCLKREQTAREEQENNAGKHKQPIILPQIMEITVLTNSAIRGEIK
jgi:hypothetical protein